MSQLQQNRLPERFYDEPFALCFSGQGFDWISSLREALADGARDRANEVAAAAARILAPVAEQLTTARPQGFEPIKWAENGADGIDLVRAAVSAPGIFLSQIANLHTLEARGLDSGKAAGVIGHSQGILGRYLMREPQHAAELLALAELIGAAATLQGRATGMYLHDDLPSMVMVQGVSRGQLAAVIDELFPADSAERPCIGLQNSADGFCRQRQARIGGARVRRVVGHGERQQRPNARKPAVAAGRGSRLPPPCHAARRGASGRMGGRLRFGCGTGAGYRAKCVGQSRGLGGRMPQHGRSRRTADFGNRPLRRRGHADAGCAGRGRN